MPATIQSVNDPIEFAIDVATRHDDILMGRSFLTVDLFALGALIDRANAIRALHNQPPHREDA